MLCVAPRGKNPAQVAGFAEPLMLAGELVHRLVMGRIGGMSERLRRKLPGLIKPPRALGAYRTAIGAVTALDRHDLVIRTGGVDSGHLSPLPHNGVVSISNSQSCKA